MFRILLPHRIFFAFLIFVRMFCFLFLLYIQGWDPREPLKKWNSLVLEQRGDCGNSPLLLQHCVLLYSAQGTLQRTSLWLGLGERGKLGKALCSGWERLNIIILNL